MTIQSLIAVTEKLSRDYPEWGGTLERDGDGDLIRLRYFQHRDEMLIESKRSMWNQAVRELEGISEEVASVLGIDRSGFETTGAAVMYSLIGGNWPSNRGSKSALGSAFTLLWRRLLEIETSSDDVLLEKLDRMSHTSFWIVMKKHYEQKAYYQNQIDDLRSLLRNEGSREFATTEIAENTKLLQTVANALNTLINVFLDARQAIESRYPSLLGALPILDRYTLESVVPDVFAKAVMDTKGKLLAIHREASAYKTGSLLTPTQPVIEQDSESSSSKFQTLTPRYKKAYAAWELAVEKGGCTTDEEAWIWLTNKENSPDEQISIPKQTFINYVIKARAHLGKSKNTKRVARKSRSVVRQSDI